MKIHLFGRTFRLSPGRRAVRMRRTLLLILILALLLFLTVKLYRSAAPIALENASIVARGHLETLVNGAVADLIKEKNYTYESFVTLHSDAQGGIAAVSTDTARLAEARSGMVSAIQTALTQTPDFGIKVPVGSLLAPALFTGKGFSVKINAMFYAAVSAEILSDVSAVGINQTVHTLSVKITLDTALYCMNRRSDLAFTYEIPLAGSLYFGNIPASFFGSVLP